MSQPDSQHPAAQPLDLAISGMSCGHCVAAVKSALQELPGVTVNQVTIGSASVSLEPGAAPSAVLDAIRDAGYDADVK